jgi:hypothetical protein
MCMTRKKTLSLLAAVCGLLELLAGTAAAQAPTVTYQFVGNRVRIEWTAIPQATAYDLLVTGSLNGQLTLPTTFVEVAAPAGTYNIQVRGVAPGVAGPYSAPVSIVVGGTPSSPAGCTAPAAPDVAVSNNGTAVNVSWGAVPGSVGYRVEVSRTPGGTEFRQDMPASQTSFGGVLPMLGTFYVRVSSGSACGALASSSEKSFTVGSPTPGPSTPSTPTTGPRAADPPPGQLLAAPAYGLEVVRAMAARYPGQLSRACKTNHEFLFLLLQEFRRIDTRWGLNWKRGDRNQGMSSDVLAYNPTNQPDEGNGQVYLFDVIGAECERNDPTYNNVTGVTWAARGDAACGAGTYCTKWTLEPYRAAGLQ